MTGIGVSGVVDGKFMVIPPSDAEDAKLEPDDVVNELLDSSR